MLKTILFIYVLFLINCCKGSNQIEYYSFSHYTSEMGLPHSLVFDMVQGNDGFIWIATNNGLGRFDGYSFKTYRPKKDGKYNISGKSINKLLLDNHNNLWLGLQGIGLNRMDLATECFYSFYPNASDTNSISGNLIESIFQDSDSVIWIGTNKGLDYYDIRLNKFTTCMKLNTHYLNAVSQIEEDIFGRIWYNSNIDGIGCYDKKTKQTYTLFEIANMNWANLPQNNGILLEDRKHLWIATKTKGLLCYNIETNRLEIEIPELLNLGSMHMNKNGDLFILANSPTCKIVVLPKHLRKEKAFKTVLVFKNPTNNYYARFCEDQYGNTWLSSEDGLYKISNTHLVTLMQSHTSKNTYLNSKDNCIFIDKMDCLWLKTERNGIIMIDLTQKPFKQYKYLKDENPVIGGNNIIAVYEDSKGKLWVGCHSEGITCYDPIAKTHKTIQYKPNDPSKIMYAAPSAFCEDAMGDIWIGFYDGGLLKINPNTMNLKYLNTAYKNNTQIKRGESIRSIVLDKENNLWLCTSSSGLVELNTKTMEFIYHSELYEKDYLANSIYRFLYQSLDGIFWTGTQNGGLGQYNKQTHKFIHYKNDVNDPNSISGNTVYHIHEQSDSILWIGTDKGLNMFNRTTQKFTQFQNLRSDFICSVYRIYPDGDNNLWLSGDCGIIEFNLETFKSITYNYSDGLPSSEFNTTAGCITSKGEIFFGSTLGLVSFYPDNIYPNPFPAKPIITQLKIFNKDIAPGDTIRNQIILEKDISLIKHLTLPHYLNDFTLEFSAMHFASPLKNNYWYKLEGYNNEWIETDATRRWANFTGLKPGTYIFHLKASNNDGLENNNEGEISLVIEIESPFQETWWFRLILFVTLILIAFIIHRLNIKSIQQQKNILSKTVAERTLELQTKNAELEERQEEITLQNDELEKHRNNLEQIVLERTEDMKAALLKAEESDRLKSAFLSNMSHEIRTPMNAILGFSSLLFESYYSDEEKAEFVQIIHSNGETLLNLLNDIIDVSIIESGQLKIRNKEIELNKLVYEVYTSFTTNKELKPRNQLLLELNAPKTTINLVTDPVRLQQILNNIIGNAFKFTKKGTISINYYLDGNKVKFEIVDSGIGIAAEKIENIFNRFNKIDNTNTEIYRGGGLGLAISKNLVEALGGKIWAESKPNQGSTFYFTVGGIIP